MEFLFGDRVRVLDGNLIGELGVITEVHRDKGLYTVKFDVGGWSYFEAEWMCLELVEAAKPEGGLKFDDGKPPMSLLPFDALEEVAKVLAYGATKYDAHNWRKGFDWSRLYSGVLRHLSAHMQGIDNDHETGLSHLAHAATGILFLVAHEKNGLGKDDRYKDENNR
jgi:hypothetical protein